MCATSYCLGEFDNAATSCPIKCLEEPTGSAETVQVKIEPGTKPRANPTLNKSSHCSNAESQSTRTSTTTTSIDKRRRYCFSGFPKECQCPICQCKCRFACVISDVPKIMQQRRIDEN